MCARTLAGVLGFIPRTHTSGAALFNYRSMFNSSSPRRKRFFSDDKRVEIASGEIGPPRRASASGVRGPKSASGPRKRGPSMLIPGFEHPNDAANARPGVQTDPHLELQVLLGLDALQLEQGTERVLHHGHRVILCVYVCVCVFTVSLLQLC